MSGKGSATNASPSLPATKPVGRASDSAGVNSNAGSAAAATATRRCGRSATLDVVVGSLREPRKPASLSQLNVV